MLFVAVVVLGGRLGGVWIHDEAAPLTREHSTVASR